jgi:uncharacterized OB-fold protein
MRPDERGRSPATAAVEVSTEATVAGTRCVACRRVHAPARRHRCLGCGSTRLSATRVELRGVFESWTRPPGIKADEGEWALGLVRLDAGPMLTVRVRLNGVPPRVGARLAGRAERREGAPEQFWFEVLPARAEAEEDRAEGQP